MYYFSQTYKLFRNHFQLNFGTTTLFYSWRDVYSFFDQQGKRSLCNWHYKPYNSSSWNTSQHGNSKWCKSTTLGQRYRISSSWKKGFSFSFFLFAFAVVVTCIYHKRWKKYIYFFNLLLICISCFQADMIVINPSSWSMVPIHDWYIYTTLIILQIMGLCSFPIKSCRVTCSISIKYSIVSYI